MRFVDSPNCEAVDISGKEGILEVVEVEGQVVLSGPGKGKC